DWEAPETESGPLTAYYVMNKSNNNGTSRGDEIFIGNEVIPLIGTASISSIENLDKEFNVKYSPKMDELQIQYKINEPSHITINVQDMTGKLILTTNYGMVNPGKNKERLAIASDIKSGIYIVSIFINNTVLNRKVFL